MSKAQPKSIVTFLWFQTEAEAAAAFYSSIFADCRVTETMRSGSQVMSVSFELGAQRFVAFNGGPHYQLTPAVSLFVSVETQAELDSIWDALIAGGGKASRCGWLVDRYGLSWQIIPTALGKLMSDPDPGRSSRAVQAMLKMGKLDIGALERAANAT